VQHEIWRVARVVERSALVLQGSLTWRQVWSPNRIFIGKSWVYEKINLPKMSHSRVSKEWDQWQTLDPKNDNVPTDKTSVSCLIKDLQRS
jgi:hypothetical protein